METQFVFPPVLDENNQPLSAEEAERSLRFEPSFIPATYEKNGVKRTYHLACNLNNVDDSAMSAHDDLKNEITAVFRTRVRAGIAKARGQEEANEDDGPTGEQIVKAGKIANSKQHKIFLDILYPKDWEKNPVILGSTSPEVPTDSIERRKWFERGGHFATIFLEAVIMYLDPTGPLAQGKQQAAKLEEMSQNMERVLAEKMSEFENLDFRQQLSETDSSAAAVPPVSTENESEPLELEEGTETDTIPNESSDSPLEDVGATEF